MENIVKDMVDELVGKPTDKTYENQYAAKDAKLSEQERENALKEFDAKQDRLYKRGRIIVTSIVILNIILTIISSYFNFNIFSLIVQVVMSVALYLGSKWARYLFIFGSAISVLTLLYAMTIISTVEIPVILITLLICDLIYSIFCCVLLFASKGVSEFLYSQGSK